MAICDQCRRRPGGAGLNFLFLLGLLACFFAPKPSMVPGRYLHSDRGGGELAGERETPAGLEERRAALGTA